MKEFVVILSENNREILADIRTLPDVKAAVFVEDNTPRIWLRGIFSKNKLPLAVQKLPIERIFILKENLLFPVGGLTPLSKLPNFKWELLSQFLPIDLPKSAFPALVEATTKVRLVISEQEQKGIALLTDFEEWLKYVENAPKIRLQRLQFAVSEHRQVLVVGDILPPIRGRVFWQDGQILLPLGLAFEWTLAAKLLAQKHDLGEKAILFFDTNSTELQKDISPQRIDLENFVDCTHSAVRLTKQNNRWTE